MEKWKQIYEGNNYPCFISSLGNLKTLSDRGIFKNKKSFIDKRSGSKIHSISVKVDNGKYQTISILAARLVMKYFVGGYYSNRKIIYLNNDKSDCRLINLKWKYGFDNGIDYDYLNKMNEKYMTKENILIKNYMLTKNIKYLFDLIDMHKGLMYVILRDYFVNSKMNDYKIDYAIHLSTILDKGRFKPSHTNTKSGENILPLMKSHWRYDALHFAKKEINKKKFCDMTKNINDNDYDGNNISEEINLMFSRYSN